MLIRALLMGDRYMETAQGRVRCSHMARAAAVLWRPRSKRCRLRRPSACMAMTAWCLSTCAIHARLSGMAGYPAPSPAREACSSSRIDTGEFRHAKPVFSERKRFVFYCASGWRSALAAKTAQDMGMVNVAHIGGGYNGLEDGWWSDGTANTASMKRAVGWRISQQPRLLSLCAPRIRKLMHSSLRKRRGHRPRLHEIWASFHDPV